VFARETRTTPMDVGNLPRSRRSGQGSIPNSLRPIYCIVVEEPVRLLE